ncbi:MAG: LysE family translocator [Candidatus Liberibacter ctenarytainae]|uniref:LysE family translocator n=1 Tax=Candidatus Liberibacter ctenarytainae TaxID=2020335 RepID=A0A937AEL3_9HYPH|nr:LysE family translocator [Candidatus Liberibacter ctenarytainae]
MPYTNLLSFLIVVCLGFVPPGPSGIQAMNHGLLYGWRKSILTIIGQETALAIIMLTAGTSTGIIMISPIVLSTIKVLGSAWLIYSGFLLIKSVSIPINSHIKDSHINSLQQCPSNLKRFITGFITCATNVRVLIFMISVMPQFIVPTQSLWEQLFIMTPLVVIVDFIVKNTYAFSASRVQSYFRDPRKIRIQGYIFGSAFIFSGISLLFPL